MSSVIVPPEASFETRPQGYGGGPEMPLGGYAALVGIYAAAYGAALAAAGRSRRFAPERTRAADLLLLGVATHKLTRLITRDWVTAPLRAPFTRYQGSAGAGEVQEKARGTGFRKAVGDLLTCPWCSGPWVAGALAFGGVLAPRATRFTAGLLTAVTISDFLHVGYESARRHSN